MRLSRLSESLGAALSRLSFKPKLMVSTVSALNLTKRKVVAEAAHAAQRHATARAPRPEQCQGFAVVLAAVLGHAIHKALLGR